MPHDQFVRQHYPEILPLLDPHGLEAVFTPAEDDSVDSAIEIRFEGSDEDLGDIQLCGRRQFAPNVWTSSAQDARAQGMPRNTAADAARDLLVLLRRHGRIATS